jgi:hypothetical protein
MKAAEGEGAIGGAQFEATGLALAQRVMTLFPNYPLRLTSIDGVALPEPYRELLHHREHLTKILEELNGGPLVLTVLERCHVDPIYSRAIRKSGQGRILEFALITIDLDKCPPRVAGQIMDERIPVGRILIDSGVPRELLVLGFCKVELAPGDLAFSVDQPTITYGRCIAIELDGVAAIHALEILAPEL